MSDKNTCLNYPCFICKEHVERKVLLGEYAFHKLFGCGDGKWIKISNETRIQLTDEQISSMTDDDILEMLKREGEWEK